VNPHCELGDSIPSIIYQCLSPNYSLCILEPNRANKNTNTYVVKKDSREQYYLICKEEIDQKHWFYYCVECNFLAHPECILKNYSCITIRSTYKSEYHEHPTPFTIWCFVCFFLVGPLWQSPSLYYLFIQK
jgi:hypothetical protein